MNSAPALAPPRVAAKLSHAFGGVWRLTFRRFLQPGHWLTVAIALGVLVLLSFGSGRPANFVGWAANSYVAFLVPALAFLAAAGAMRDEMKSGTVDYVLTRPVPRPAFVGFKYLSHMACTQLDFLLALAVVYVVGTMRDAPGLGAALPRLLFGQVLLVAAFSAFGFFCATVTARYFVMGLTYAGVIEAGVGQIPTQLSRLSMTHQVRDFLLPVVHPAADLTAAPGWLVTAAILIAFAAVMVAATATLFSVRELSGPGE